MNDIEVLILNGSPGSGKSTLASAISDMLRKQGASHAVVDLDELARVYPESTTRNLKWQNLAAVWPNYQNANVQRVIIPVLIDTADDLQTIKAATPSKSFTICELTAATSTLKNRVIEREPNKYWQDKISGLVDNYEQRDKSSKFADLQVSTDDKTIDEAAKEIINKLGWAS